MRILGAVLIGVGILMTVEAWHPGGVGLSFLGDWLLLGPLAFVAGVALAAGPPYRRKALLGMGLLMVAIGCGSPYLTGVSVVQEGAMLFIIIFAFVGLPGILIVLIAMRAKES